MLLLDGGEVAHPVSLIFYAWRKKNGYWRQITNDLFAMQRLLCLSRDDLTIKWS